MLGEVSEGGGGRGLARGAAYPFGLSPSAGCAGVSALVSRFTFIRFRIRVRHNLMTNMLYHVRCKLQLVRCVACRLPVARASTACASRAAWSLNISPASTT